MIKKKAKNAGIAGLLFTLSGLVALYAWIPFGLKFIVDVFVTHLPFWGSFGYNLFMLLLTEVIAVICLILFGGLTFTSLKGK